MERLTNYRRDLHRIPEIGTELPLTVAYIRQALAPLNCRLISLEENALCAFFDGGKDHATAFRSDMDALPVEEGTHTEYQSTHPGKMHACGHDGHMAMLLELAHYIDEHLEELPCNVLLVFQPAEETTGGAEKICNSGIFEAYNVRQIFGFHLWPELPPGAVAARRGAMLARSSEVSVSIEGRSTHVARAEEGIDALFAGTELVRRAYRMAETEIGQSVGGTLKFGKFQSGSARNIISGHTELLGSVRAFEDPLMERLQAGLRQVATELEKETGCQIAVNFSQGYPAVWNTEELYDRVAAFLEPEGFLTLEKPCMIAEDFSYYQRRLPGLLFFLGIGGKEPLHSAYLDFDEGVLEKGVELYTRLLYFK